MLHGLGRTSLPGESISLATLMVVNSHTSVQNLHHRGHANGREHHPGDTALVAIARDHFHLAR